LKTSNFVGGTAMVFERDDYGPDIMTGFCPQPKSDEQCNALFNRTGRMFRDIFRHAHSLGVKTCVGLELPLTIPKDVEDRLRAAGKDPHRPEVIRELFEGIFRRASKAYPVDYFWLWTCELWTWLTPKAEDVALARQHLLLAQEAIDRAKPPFTLATCGWTLGPPMDRAGWDKLLPKKSPLGCINQLTGYAPVEPAFGTIHDRPLWAIPWMEFDSGMIVPQFWVGRTQYDAVDALRYGCTGLFGIHWRTKQIAPTLAALAQAGWSQPRQNQMTVPPIGRRSGDSEAFCGRPIAGADDPTIYQTVRHGVHLDPYRPPIWAWQIRVPNGVYSVTLKMVEPTHNEPKRRTFDVVTLGNQICFQLDIFNKVGKNHALDMSVSQVRATDGAINLFLCCQVDYPSIAGIVIDGIADPVGDAPARHYARKINCGGPACNSYEADDRAILSIDRRTTPTADFFRDWAAANFGPNVADRVAAIFGKLDGIDIPAPAEGCPGNVRVNQQPWSEEQRQYQFVGELESLRAQIAGAGNLERFDYWLDTFRFMRAMAQFGCMRGELDRIVARLDKQKDAKKRTTIARSEALPVRIEMARLWSRMLSYQLACVNTPGELGTIACIEQGSRVANSVLACHDKTIAAALGSQLPGDVQPSRDYSGPARILLLTAPSSVAVGTSVPIKVFLVAPQKARGGSLFWRPLGVGNFSEVRLNHVTRAVYQAMIPPQNEATIAIEYYVRATWADGSASVWPATAPSLCQTATLQFQP
jgi:hypothetical protein